MSDSECVHRWVAEVRDILSLNPYPPFVRPCQESHELQGRGLPTSASTQKADRLTSLYIEGQSFYWSDRPVTLTDREEFDGQCSLNMASKPRLRDS